MPRRRSIWQRIILLLLAFISLALFHMHLLMRRTTWSSRISADSDRLIAINEETTTIRGTLGSSVVSRNKLHKLDAERLRLSGEIAGLYALEQSQRPIENTAQSAMFTLQIL